ncbi:MAG: 7TM diverse intracellular signaling domain-containing protein [Thermoplasmata archaeon]
MGLIYEKDQVYINGNLIGDNQNKENFFGKPRIYYIPKDILIEGENTIAIRISSSLGKIGGILSQPIGIFSNQKALNIFWKHQIIEFIFVGFFLFVSLFYLLNYYKIPEQKEYLSFSIFALVYGIYEFSRTHIALTIFDNFNFFKFIEYSTLILIPYLFLRFIKDYFNYEGFRYLRIYFIFNILLIIILLIIHNPKISYKIIGYWDLHLPIVLGLIFYVSLKKITQNPLHSYINILGLIYITYAVIKQILIERGFIYSESSLEYSVVFYFVLTTLSLRLKFLLKKLAILKRYDQLKEADNLREKVFSHMNLMISQPLNKMRNLISELKNPSDKNKKLDIIQNIETIQNNLQPLMDDIIELSRLEVMEEVPFKTSVPFVDFIREVIPENSITYSIRVSPNTIIENSLELINSIVIRLIDFPPIKEFTHNDLIITQDLQGNIHFRFLLFHKNPKIAIKVFNELTFQSNKEDNNIIKWRIIQQIARLLNANLECKLIKKKYLRIDLGLQAAKPVSQELLTSELVPIQSKDKLNIFEKILLALKKR